MGQTKNKPIPDHFLMCREGRHPWEIDYWFYVDHKAVGRVGSCPRCDSGKVEYISKRTGEITKRVYTYARDYTRPGQGRIWPKDARKQLLPKITITTRPDPRLNGQKGRR